MGTVMRKLPSQSRSIPRHLTTQDGQSEFSLGRQIRRAERCFQSFLCPSAPNPAVFSTPRAVNTPVVFGMSTLNMTQWPMDLYMYGTGFDAYVLDERGSDVLGPARFNIHMPW